MGILEDRDPPVRCVDRSDGVLAAELGEAGTTHFNATTEDDWYTHLDKLLSDEELRSQMGNAGRQHSLNNFTVARQAELLASTLREAKRKT